MALCDIALVYDPAKRRCDNVFDGTDLVLDFTPVTPVLMCVGNDRRAHPDDALPAVARDDYAPPDLLPRGGWPGDWMSPTGGFLGSRVWLYRGGKQTEATRRGVEVALGESLEAFAALYQLPIAIVVRWLRRGMLGYQVSVGNATVPLELPVAG